MQPLLLLILFGAIALLIRLIGTRNRVTDQDIAWLANSGAVSAQSAEVYRSYLARHRTHRLAGAMFGALFATVVGIQLYQTVGIGIVENGNPLADVWFCALAGIIFGAFSAETFRLSEPPSNIIAASLTDRGITPDRWVLSAARTVTSLMLVVGIGAALLGAGIDALAISIGGALLSFVAHRTLRAIAYRRRPLLSRQAKTIDIALRAFATRSVALLQLSAALLVAVWVHAKLPESQSLELQATRTILSYSALAGSLYSLWLARARPPRQWSLSTEAVLA